MSTIATTNDDRPQARYPFDAATVKLHQGDGPALPERFRNYLYTLPFLSPSAVLVFTLLLLSFLHGAGIFLFTRGFLLTRLALENRNECSPMNPRGLFNSSCSFPPTHSKMVLIIIDALRSDFVFPVDNTSTFTPSPFYHNHLTLPSQLNSLHPSHSFLGHFIADAPTTTLQRLKGLTTGSLPTFVDAGSNFAGEKVGEDNWLEQAKKNGKRIALIGDETWLNVFPKSSTKEGVAEESVWAEAQVYPYDSFNVEDLDTVDKGVVEHLIPMLNSNVVGQGEWDIIIAHSLGLDHAGHRFGPEHYEMTRKLKETQNLLEKVVDRLDNETLLVVMGDHGMTDRGDHGGDSREEVEAALWIYSKEVELTHSSWFEENSIRSKLVEASKGAGELGDQLELSWKEKGVGNTRSVAQVDLVPTLSLLLGLPIPFGSLGLVIPELFYRSTFSNTSPPSPNHKFIPQSGFFRRVAEILTSQDEIPPSVDTSILSPIQTLLQAHYLTASQLFHYFKTYTSTSSGSDLLPSMEELESILSEAQISYNQSQTATLSELDQKEIESKAIVEFWNFSRTAREKARNVWAKFDESLMVVGLLVYLGSLIVGLKIWDGTKLGPRARGLLGSAVEGALLASWITLALWLLSAFELAGITNLSTTWIIVPIALGAELGVILAPSTGFTFTHIKLLQWKRLGPLVPMLLHAAIFASNSFTVFEDRIILFLLSSLLVFQFIRSLVAPEARLRKRLIIFSSIALICVRLMAYSTICREEQMPRCEITFHYPAGSISALIIVGLAFIAAWFIPTILRKFLSFSASDTGLAPIFLSSGIRSLLILSVGYWLIDWTIAGLGLGIEGTTLATVIKTGIARVVMVGSILSAFLIWYVSPLCLTVQKEEIKDPKNNNIVLRTQIKFIGFANTFGSTYLLYFSSLFSLIFLLNSPPAQLILTLNLIILLSLLEIFDSERDINFLKSNFSYSTMESLLNNEIPIPPSHTGPTFIQISILALLSHLSFFSTGHQASLSTIQWSTAFIGFPTLMYPFSPILVVLNTLSPFIITSLSIPLFVFWNLSPTLKDQSSLNLYRNLLKSTIGYSLYQSCIGISITFWSAWFKRHLMVWKIFAPRFMLSSITVLMTDFILVGFAIGFGSLVVIKKVKILLGTKVSE